MASAMVSRFGAPATDTHRSEWISFRSLPFVISILAAAMSAIAGGLTLFVPDVLRGPAVMNGSGRGTAAVALFVAVPLLVVSMIAVGRGATRPVISALGANAYLVYNAVMFLFVTPINELFLVYIAMFALCFWTAVTVLRRIDVASFARHFSVAFPLRALATALAVIGVLNGMAWLVRIVPALLDSNPGSLVQGTGVATNAGYVQDLSFWIPAMLVTAWWTWKGRAWGFVLTGTLFVFGVIECISIAVDQWMGGTADPSSTLASTSMSLPFAIAAVVMSVPAYFYFKSLNRA